MTDFPPNYASNDEIDLGELILGLWDGKWILAGTVALGLGLGALTSALLPDRFSFAIDIQPITTVQADAYDELNALGFFDVSRSGLVSLFVETMEQREPLIEAFDEVGYLSADAYPEEADYQNALRAVAFGLELTPPDSEPPERREMRRFWELSASGENEDLFRQALSLAFELTEDEVKEFLGSGLPRRWTRPSARDCSSLRKRTGLSQMLEPTTGQEAPIDLSSCVSKP